jgi:hypothetical protein
MGKTFVARGVIARAIEHLEADSTVPRIDIVYVCSNSDIAAQNIRRLDVVGGQTRAPARRLTLLATHIQDLDRSRSDGGKTINLVAFTPGTSFELAGQGGIAEERALLHLLLSERYDLARAERTASKRLLKGGVATLGRFNYWIDTVGAQIDSGVDANIVKSFLRQVTRSKVGHRYRQLVADVTGRRPTQGELSEAWELIGDLRHALARASIEALQADLVILDEFQRFKHLLDRSKGGDAADLAHHLFEYPDVRVLLLSATPYKMYTLAEESSLGEDHHEDFLDTIRFLGQTSGPDSADIAADFASLRTKLVQGGSTGEIAGRLSDQLRKVMCRTERPDLDGHGMLTEHLDEADSISADDLIGYVELRKVADAVDAALSIEYWKSAPYFINFIDGYQLGTRLRSALEDDFERSSLRPLLVATQRLNREALRKYAVLDLANPKLRELAEHTVAAGWWKLLWLPPSMPYYAPEGPWTSAAHGMTKRIIFSSWAAAPTAIASLLSYEAERLAAEASGVENSSEARRRMASRLDFRLTDGRAGAMTALSLFWPLPSLASACDPLRLVSRAPDRVPLLPETLEWASGEVRARVGGDGRSTGTAAEAWYWTLPFTTDNGLRELLGDVDATTLIEALAGSVGPEEDERPDQRGLTAHVDRALAAISEAEITSGRPPDLTETVALMGLASPGNCAWRALSRVIKPGDSVTALGHWRAAAHLASGFRTLFNRPDTTLLMDRILPRDTPYWRNVLAYCASGSLQAVLDEYLHHLAEDEGFPELDDWNLLALAEKARAAIALRPATYRAFDPLHPDTSIRFFSRFALRYGTLRQKDDDARLPELRAAFNSPFRPFVLASTSIGQEGVDFHWWCHAIVHWNTPPNPVDFEQREGRITRYKGHAIRRNVAAGNRRHALTSNNPDPWAAAFAAAADQRPIGSTDVFPYWVYPGPASIERHVPQLPLSRDQRRFLQVRDTLTLYRLAFGQPRQEDLVALLARSGAPASPEGFTGLIDLRPPRMDLRTGG